MRVLHVTECFGGGVRRAIEAAIALTPEHEHHVLWTGDEQPEGAVAERAVALPAGLRARIAAVGDRVQALAPDVLVAHSSWAGVYARARRLPVPVVYEPHCYKHDDPTTSAPLRAAYRTAEAVLARRSAATVVLSPHEDALTRALRPDGVRVLVPNVASVEPGREHAATGFATGDRVLMIGRLVPQKAPEWFEAVARAVHATRPEVRFTWAGDGDPAVRASLEAAGVEVTGWLDADGMREVLAAPSIYLHTAAYEGFPLSILDAAAFEHPVVARAIPAFDGFDIPSADAPDALARLVVEVLDGGAAADAARQAAIGLTVRMHPAAQAAAWRDVLARAAASAVRAD